MLLSNIPPLTISVVMLWAIACFALYDFPRGNAWRWLARSLAPAYVAIVYLVAFAWNWAPAQVSFYGRLGILTLGIAFGLDVFIQHLIRRGYLARWKLFRGP